MLVGVALKMKKIKNMKCSFKNNFNPLCNSGLCRLGTTMILIFRVALQKCLPFQDMQSQVSIKSSLYFAILYRTCRYRFRNWVGFQTRAYFSLSDYNPSLTILKLTWITFYEKKHNKMSLFQFFLENGRRSIGLGWKSQCLIKSQF